MVKEAFAGGELCRLVAPRLHDYCSLQATRKSRIVEGVSLAEEQCTVPGRGGVQGMPVVWIADLQHRRLLPHSLLQSVAIVIVVLLDRVALNRIESKCTDSPS
jgi:hypothetical protein